jgi:hypothetical protein
LIGRPKTHDLVVAAIAVAQLAFDVEQRFRIVIDRDHDRVGHRRTLSSEAHALQVAIVGREQTERR